MKWACRASLWSLVCLVLTACSSLPAPPVGQVEINASPWAVQSQGHRGSAALAGRGAWNHLTFPGKSPTAYSYFQKDGRDAVAAVAESSASMLRSKVRIESQDLGSVRFSWMVPQLIANADMGLRDVDDSPVRIVLVFEGDRSRFSARDALVSELAHTLTGEPMPYATLMYVWCNKRAPGSVIKGPRTDRIRKMVVESGAGRLNQWLDYERDIRADFQRAFGELPGALLGIGIMSDSDNTRSSARSWFGPLHLGSQAMAKN